MEPKHPLSGEATSVFKRLSDEIANLHLYWRIDQRLFGSGTKRVKLLNKTGPFLFRVFQDMVYDYVTLTLSRLTDPGRQGKYDNCSLEYLVKLLNEEKAIQIANDLRMILDELEQMCKPFRVRRDKVVAHNDLITAIAKDAKPLPAILVRDVDTALAELRRFMNAFNLYFFDSQTMYEDIIAPEGEANLIMNLKMAMTYKEMEKSCEIKPGRWREGEYGDA